MPTAPESLPKASCSKASVEAVEVAVGLEGEAGEAQAEGRRLGVDAVGAADAERVAVLQRPLDQGVAVGAGAGQDHLARLAQLQRQRRVEHVGGGQPVVDPAPVLADRGGDHVDEGGDVVVGHLLALVDRLDREGGVRPRRLRRLARHDALLGPGLRRRQLDLEPALELALRRPDRADLGARVPGDHALIIRAARMPAFFAPSIATQATGIPGGICTAESRASRPPRLLPRIGTPITGRSLWAAATPGSAADIPAPAMITFSPRIRALVQYSRTSSGSRWALITRTSWLIPASSRAAPAGFHLRHVVLRAHDDPDQRLVDVDLLERLLDLRRSRVGIGRLGLL